MTKRTVAKRRIPAEDAVLLEADPDDAPVADGSPDGDEVVPFDEDAFEGFDADVEVLEYEVVGAQFTVDTLVARLHSDGVPIVRSSPFELNVQMGGIARLGEHKLIFRAQDRDAVGDALRTAGLL